jgi:hypothetical protein
MLSYGELLSVCGLGERLHFWSMAYPCIENGNLGIRALRGTWAFIPALDVGDDPQLVHIVEAIQGKGNA